MKNIDSKKVYDEKTLNKIIDEISIMLEQEQLEIEFHKNAKGNNICSRQKHIANYHKAVHCWCRLYDLRDKCLNMKEEKTKTIKKYNVTITDETGQFSKEEMDNVAKDMMRALNNL